MKLWSLPGCAALVSVAAAAQAPPEFEVASIRPSAEQVQAASIGLHITASQVRISYLSLKDYVGMAYDIPTGRVERPGRVGRVGQVGQV